MSTEESILEELRAIRELLEQAPEQVFNVFIQGESVDQDRLQTALDRFRR